MAGVRTVAHDLTVKILGGHARNDSDIAVATQRALSWNVLVPKTVTAKVHDGIVTLEGRVSWNYAREAAADAVRYLTGVVFVGNNVTREHGGRPDCRGVARERRVHDAVERSRYDACTTHQDVSPRLVVRDRGGLDELPRRRRAAGRPRSQGGDGLRGAHARAIRGRTPDRRRHCPK